jgi:hypothetical protein
MGLFRLSQPTNCLVIATVARLGNFEVKKWLGLRYIHCWHESEAYGGGEISGS